MLEPEQKISYGGINLRNNQPRTNFAKMGKLTCMQIPTTFCIGGRYDICQLLDIYGVKDVGQIEIHTAEPSVLEPSSFVAVMAI
jgi:hypothetical protein